MIPNVIGSYIQLTIDPHTTVQLHTEKNFTGNIFYNYTNNADTSNTQLVQIPPDTTFGSMAIFNAEHFEPFSTNPEYTCFTYVNVYILFILIIILYYVN